MAGDKEVMIMCSVFCIDLIDTVEDVSHMCHTSNLYFREHYIWHIHTEISVHVDTLHITMAYTQHVHHEQS